VEPRRWSLHHGHTRQRNITAVHRSMRISRMRARVRKQIGPTSGTHASVTQQGKHNNTWVLLFGSAWRQIGARPSGCIFFYFNSIRKQVVTSKFQI
jgi:hypothetical protein